MKQNILVLALLGLLGGEAAATKVKMDLGKMMSETDQVLTQFEDIDSSLPINQLVIVNNQKKHRFSPQMAQSHEDDSSSDSDSGDSESDDDQQKLQLRNRHNKSKKHHVSFAQSKRLEETQPDFEGFPASLHGFVGNNHNDGQWKDSYDRVVPGHLDDTDGVPVDKFTANVISNYATEGVSKEGLPNGQFFITHDQTMALAREVVQTHLGKKGKELDEYLQKKFQATWDHYDVNSEGILEANWASPFMRTLCKPEKYIDLQ